MTQQPDAPKEHTIKQIIETLVNHGVCTTQKRKTCEDCQNRIKTAIRLLEADRNKATEPILKAWNVAGSHPGYHRQQQERLLREWPTLYWAIQQLQSEQRKGQ